jgi:2'-5' RNA ligase
MLQKVRRYMLAFSPSQATTKQVRTLKMTLRQHLGFDYPSSNSEAHISLFIYEATAAQQKAVVHCLQRIIPRFTPFVIRYNGLASLGISTIAFNLDAESNEKLRECINRIKKDTRGLKVKLHNVGKNPHMTIARRLSGEKVVSALRILPSKNPPEDYCNHFVIRMLNEDIGQYETILTIRFEDLKEPDDSDRQFSLF